MEKNEVPEDLSESEWEHVQFDDNKNLALTEESVFPPNDHEGLPVTTVHKNEQVHEPQPVLQSCSDDDGTGGVEKAETDSNKSKRLHLAVLNSGLFQILLKFNLFKVGLWSVSGVAAALLLSFLHRRVLQWRKSVKMERRVNLLLLIKEKDKKIEQLLLQIAQMNEILLARKKVPVLRVH